jgi:hypothetical protein
LPQKAQEGTKTDVPILRFVVLFVAIFTFVRALVARQPRRDHRCSSVVNDFCHVRLTNATTLVDGTEVAPEKPIEGLTLADITGNVAKGIALQHVRNAVLRDIKVTGLTGPLLATADVTGTGLDGAVTYVAPTPAARQP